jgi:hypothetical protein
MMVGPGATISVYCTIADTDISAVETSGSVTIQGIHKRMVRF